MASSPPPPRELHGRRLHPAAVVRDKLARALPGNAALVEDLAGLVDAMNAAPPAPRMLFAMPLFVGPAGIGKSYPPLGPAPTVERTHEYSGILVQGKKGGACEDFEVAADGSPITDRE